MAERFILHSDAWVMREDRPIAVLDYAVTLAGVLYLVEISSTVPFTRVVVRHAENPWGIVRTFKRYH